MTTKKPTYYTHWRNGRESRACDGSTANPAFSTRDVSRVTCPKCAAKAEKTPTSNPRDSK